MVPLYKTYVKQRKEFKNGIRVGYNCNVWSYSAVVITLNLGTD